MEAIAYESQQLDHLGIIAGMCREIDLIGQIDTCIDQKERKVTVGRKGVTEVFAPVMSCFEGLWNQAQHLSRR